MKKIKEITLAVLMLMVLALNIMAQSAPNLVNYQGLLTDQTGAPLPAGTYLLQFKLWDGPTAGNLIWGQQQTITIQPGGYFNVILGSPSGTTIPAPTTDLNSAFAATNRYLGVTVLANNGGIIQSPTEILPRQQILTVPYAISAVSAVNAGTATAVVPGSITTASLAPGIIQTTNVADGSISLSKLAPRAVGTNVPIGGMAISLSCGTNAVSGTEWTNVANLVVTLVTTGRPVQLQIIPDSEITGYTNAAAYSRLYNNGGEMQFMFTRNDQPTSAPMDFNPAYPQGIPPQLSTLDWLAPGGTNTYKLQMKRIGGTCEIRNVRLVAYEL